MYQSSGSMYKNLINNAYKKVIANEEVAGVMEKGIVKGTYVGTSQGGNLSQLLSNIMLNELDKGLEARGLVFLLYQYEKIHI